MDTHIVKAWQDVSQPEGLDIERARQRFQDMVTAVQHVDQWELPTLTGERVHAAFRGLKLRKAAGARGWNASDLRQLPLEAAQEMAALMRTAEDHGNLPSEWRLCLMSLIPKGGDSNTGAQPPGKLRPISVLPQVARVWSQLRFQDIMEKILPSVLGCQHGGLPRRQARTIAARLLVRMDASARDRHLGGKGNFCFAQLDLRKYFNCIDVCAVESLWTRLGMPAAFARLLSSHYSQMVVRTRYHLGFLGKGFCMQRGVPQGDALSVLYSVVFLIPLLVKVLDSVPGLDMKQLSVYLDDVTVEAA
eukprot:5453790-Amphidinium_carterae.1